MRQLLRVVREFRSGLEFDVDVRFRPLFLGTVPSARGIP